ncbi:MAG: deoxyribodipyrimidine photolyase, partial [Deltaproteobacteria bacterium]|nr:deoxyribodipyrimidine photolyase [Deltaproteobacteria bacterium]
EFAEKWRVEAGRRLSVALWTVGADLVVPSRALPPGEFWAAHSLRPKIARQLATWLAPASEPIAEVAWPGTPPLSQDPQDWRAFLARLGPLPAVAGPVALVGGRQAGLQRLGHWLNGGLGRYTERRDDPTEDGTSRLSPYLHFGQLGPREVAQAACCAPAPAEARDAFVEQLVVRRELAWHFAARNPHHASLQGCEAWALKSLKEQAGDRRPFRYTYAELEQAATHDPAWNAAQRQMVQTGWMHNRMRMYWAKQLLLWTDDPQQAFAFALRLNDTWQLDGRDPNGYAGIAWAIGGKHDRPWPPRKPVWGLVRPMVASGLAKKFNAELYVRQPGAGQPDLG